MGAEPIQGEVRHGHGPEAPGRLRVLEGQMAVDVGQCLVDPDGPGIPVNVVDAQGDQLAEAESAVAGDQDGGLVAARRRTPPGGAAPPR